MHARVRSAIHDRFLGVLFGAAVGDALGIVTEFQSGAAADEYVRANMAAHGGRMSLLHWPGRAADGSVLAEEASRYHHNFWRQGDWSDDTDQHILIVQTLLNECAASDGALRVGTFARRFVAWLDHGFPEFGDTQGVGAGSSTKLSGSNPLTQAGDDASYTGLHSWAHPFFSACRRGSSNGSLMRTGILGAAHFFEADALERDARLASMATHGGPECAPACISACTVIAALVRDAVAAAGSADSVDGSHTCSNSVVEAAIALGEERGVAALLAAQGSLSADIDALCSALSRLPYDHQEYNMHGPAIRETVEAGAAFIAASFDPAPLRAALHPGSDLSALALDAAPIGFVYKTLAAGTWALTHTNSFADGIEALLRRGGDADINAAVAGALMGARFGLAGIPTQWRDALCHGEWLRELGTRLADRVCQRYQDS